MHLNISGFSAGVPALCLCLVIFYACGTMAAEFPYTVYRGTFIHLPRLNSSSAKTQLARNQGVLWVSSADGRIKGYDWGVHDDASFQSFLSRHGWTDDAANDNSKSTEVKVIVSNDERNEFFFPGFVGMPPEYHTIIP